MSTLGQYKIHQAIDPTIVFIAEEMARQRISQLAMSLESGVSAATIGGWIGGRHVGILPNVEAVLNVLGYTLVVEPLPKMRARISGAPRPPAHG